MSMRKRQQGIPAEITEIAWKVQNHLHKRYMKLMSAGKDQRKVMTAIGRELLGFIWRHRHQGRASFPTTDCCMKDKNKNPFQIGKKQKP
jgi:hypothetical protein